MDDEEEEEEEEGLFPSRGSRTRGRATFSTPSTAVDVVLSLCCRRGRHAVQTAKARPGSEGGRGMETLR
jgi:hypothetical protein